MSDPAHALHVTQQSSSDPGVWGVGGTDRTGGSSSRLRFVGLSHPMGVVRPDGPVTDAEVHGFLQAVLDADEEAGGRWLSGARQRGLAIEDLYLDVIGPAAALLGDAWADDTMDFLQVTEASGRLQRLVRELAPAFVAAVSHADPVGRVLLSAAPGAQHTLGMSIVAEFMARDGWDVTFAPPGTVEELVAAVRHHHFDVLALSVSCEASLREVFRAVKAVRRATRNPALQVLVGGSVFAHAPGLARTVGADACVLDVRRAGEEARHLLSVARQDS